MSAADVDRLYDEPHDEPFETCPNCVPALTDEVANERVFLGRTWRQIVRLRHNESIRMGAFVEALFRPREADGNVVTYEVVNSIY